jgi:hypothetical protein
MSGKFLTLRYEVWADLLAGVSGLLLLYHGCFLCLVVTIYYCISHTLANVLP